MEVGPFQLFKFCKLLLKRSNVLWVYKFNPLGVHPTYFRLATAAVYRRLGRLFPSS